MVEFDNLLGQEESGYYTKKQRIIVWELEAHQCSYEYYVQSGSSMSDFAYDCLVRNLQFIYDEFCCQPPAYSILNTVGYNKKHHKFWQDLKDVDAENWNYNCDGQHQ